MQLYEQGKLNLDADVNRYLKDFKIPETYPEPITLKHLFAHTPGFEDVISGMAARKADDLVPLKDFLRDNIPERVFPPGQYTAYSNYGTALAGYIVEIVSGKPFEDYIEEFIYEPIGMEMSTFRQPLPSYLSEDMSAGYSYKKGKFEGEGFEFINGMAPAGSMSSTAADMARFMIAHLQDGFYEGNRILEAETARLMHSLLFTHDARIPGNAYGFWETKRNGLRILGHKGDTLLFHSLLALIPEYNAGFFVSYNSAGAGGPARDFLFQAFLDRYYPSPESLEWKPFSDYKNRAKRYVGNYGMLRGVYSSYEKIARLLMTSKLKAGDDGTLVMSLPAGLGAKRWIEVSPLFFREVGGQGYMIFFDDARGRITHAYIDETFTVFKKLKWHEVPVFHYILLIVCVLLFISSAIGWPLGALRRRLCPVERERKKFPKFPRLVAGLMSALFLAFLVGLAGVLMNYMELMFGVPPLLKSLSVLNMIAVILAVGVLLCLLLIWGRAYWTICGRIHYTLVFLAGCAFIWFINYWHLFGFKF
jgi:CubicO group peptidase (beta-lactamase class C family)